MFSSFKAAFIRRKLVDATWLSHRLGEVAKEFEQCYGDEFKESMDSNPPPGEVSAE